MPDARTRFSDDAPLSAFGARLAASYGELAARIRRAVSIADASAAGFQVTRRRGVDLDAALACLHASAAPEATKAAAERARPWLVALPPPDTLVHCDLHFFNMCLADDGTITGVFDLDDAGFDHAEAELLYIHSLGPRFVTIALDAYGPVDLDAVRRAHVRCAIEHLLWHGPATPRHASILEWITAALERLV